MTTRSFKRIRAAVIGLGVGEQHLRAYIDHPNCEVVWAADFDEAKLNEMSKKYPLVILRNSISSCEIRLAELDQILSSPAPNFDGKKTSAELTQLKSEWLSFVDKNSPKSEEYAAASTPPSSAPKHLFDGPPRTPSVSLKGQIDENGREWIEYPPGSDRWHYRLMSRGEWMQWRD